MFLSLVLFLSTLQSFYVPAIGISLPPMLGAFLMISFLLIKRNIINLNTRFFVLSFSLIVYSIFNALLNDSNISEQVKSIAGLVLSLGGAFSLYIYCDEIGVDKILKSIEHVIYLHLLFFTGQIIYFAVTFNFLDYLLILGIDESAYKSLKGIQISGWKIPRFTGLFNEPGTYSIFMSILASFLIFKGQRISFAALMGFLSCIISMSLFGIILSLSALTIFFISKLNNIKQVLPLILTGGVLLFAGYTYIAESIEQRLDSDYSGVSERSDFVESYLSLPPDKLMLGLGIVPDSIDSSGISTNDNGIFFVFILAYGFFGYLIIAMFFLNIIQDGGWAGTAVFFIMLLAKVKLTYPFFWFILALLLIKKITDERNHNNEDS
jgi:hypothetical protein